MGGGVGGGDPGHFNSMASISIRIILGNSRGRGGGGEEPGHFRPVALISIRIILGNSSGMGGGGEEPGHFRLAALISIKIILENSGGNGEVGGSPGIFTHWLQFRSEPYWGTAEGWLVAGGGGLAFSPSGFNFDQSNIGEQGRLRMN